MDLFAFGLPRNAGVAVLVENGRDPEPLDVPRTLGVERALAEDPGVLLQTLDGMRGEEGVEFLLVPQESLAWLDSHRALADTLTTELVPVGRDDEAGALYSLHEQAHRIAPDGLPLPPVHLVRVTSGCIRQAHRNQESMYRSYFEGGRMGAAWIRDMLADAGADMEEMGAILDFGCGCGRVIRHWRDLERTMLHGTDYNPFLAGWCSDGLPFAQFAVNGSGPPLQYEDDTFDLAYSISIFTHLDAHLQRPWIEELGRVVRPGGMVLVSVRVPTSEADYPYLDEADRGRADRGELVVKNAYASGRDLCAAFHPEPYIRDEFARGFELVELVIGGARDVRQDALLLRVPA